MQLLSVLFLSFILITMSALVMRHLEHAATTVTTLCTHATHRMHADTLLDYACELFKHDMHIAKKLATRTSYTITTLPVEKSSITYTKIQENKFLVTTRVSEYSRSCILITTAHPDGHITFSTHFE